MIENPNIPGLEHLNDDKKIELQSVSKVFSQQSDFIIIGLTGKFGAGCTTIVSDILTKEFVNIGLEKICAGDFNHHYEKADCQRDVRTIYRFAEDNWKPFNVIKGRDAITSFLLELDYEQFSKLIIDDSKEKDKARNLTSKFSKAIVNQIDKLNKAQDNSDTLEYKIINNENTLNYRELLSLERYQHLSLRNLYNEISSFNHNFIKYYDNKIDESTNDILFENYIYIKYILPAFAEALKEHFEKLYPSMFQNFGNEIRYWGRIVLPEEDTKETIVDKANLFSLAKRMNRMIKTYRHPAAGADEPVRIVIDAMKNYYESYYLKERYSSYYLIAILKDEDKRYESNKSNPDKCTDNLEDIDLNEAPSSSYKLYKKYMKLNEKVTEKEDLDKVFKKSYIKDYGLSQEEFKYCQELKKDKLRLKLYENKLYPFYLQDITKCIQNADIFITNNEDSGGKHRLKYSLLKYISLIMHPGLVLPTNIERCMQIAFTAKVNSGCISRQVGAVVTDSDYNILSVGWNDVPCGMTPCIRRNIMDLIKFHDESAYSDFEIDKNSSFRKHLDDSYDITEIKKIKDVLMGLPAVYCFKDIYEKITSEKNQVHTRAMHGEEKALLICDQQRVQGGNLFTTSSPCELCSKNAKQHKIKNIYYIEAYKGIAQDHVSYSGNKDFRATYHLFEGAISRAYNQLFTPLIPLKDEIELRNFWQIINKNKEKNNDDKNDDGKAGK